ncbi:MAG: alanine--glyoxylate aminotransferase family protein [Synergistaceae bacterium]|jgi:aspartate aminotransferase-like enzyme|nr:alanine--glyoxylate aminotransferase family protein [Synergistaceae bacterium]
MIQVNPLVMVPGPTPIARSIQEQMAKETIAFHDPRFIADFDALVLELKNTWRCDGMAFAVAGSGTMAMEMAVSNTARRGDSVLVCSNGHFGDRYIDICSRKGYDLDTIKAPPGDTVSLEEIDERLAGKKTDVLVVTHVETSTGVELPLFELADMMRLKHPDVLLVADGVASAGAVEFYMDWGIDVMLTCSQKGMGMAPGLGILWASQRAIEKRLNMPAIAESYIDFAKWIPVMKDARAYWGTPPINMIWALAEAVRIIKGEGIGERDRRHRRFAAAVRKSVSSLGFKLAADEHLASPTVSAFLYPEGAQAKDEEFRAAVYDEGAHIAGCQGDLAGAGFRVGHMGNITANTLVSLVAAIERGCLRCGYPIKPGSALAVLQEELVAIGSQGRG